MRELLRRIVIVELCLIIGVSAALGIVIYQHEHRSIPNPCIVTYMEHGYERTDFIC